MAARPQLASDRLAMIDDGIDLRLVPWQPVLGQQIGQRIAAVIRNVGGIVWSFGRQ